MFLISITIKTCLYWGHLLRTIIITGPPRLTMYVSSKCGEPLRSFSIDLFMKVCKMIMSICANSNFWRFVPLLLHVWGGKECKGRKLVFHTKGNCNKLFRCTETLHPIFWGVSVQQNAVLIKLVRSHERKGSGYRYSFLLLFYAASVPIGWLASKELFYIFLCVTSSIRTDTWALKCLHLLRFLCRFQAGSSCLYGCQNIFQVASAL